MQNHKIILIEIGIVGFVIGFMASQMVSAYLLAKSLDMMLINKIEVQNPEDWKREVYLEKYNQIAREKLSKFEDTVEVGTFTAYSCGGIENEEQLLMNCPSLLNSDSPKTANGGTPVAYATVACSRDRIGEQFYIKGIGKVVCNDTGGAIKGEHRFDLYVDTISNAFNFGVKKLEYGKL